MTFEINFLPQNLRLPLAHWAWWRWQLCFCLPMIFLLILIHAWVGYRRDQIARSLSDVQQQIQVIRAQTAEHKVYQAEEGMAKAQRQQFLQRLFVAMQMLDQHACLQEVSQNRKSVALIGEMSVAGSLPTLLSRAGQITYFDSPIITEFVHHKKQPGYRFHVRLPMHV